MFEAVVVAGFFDQCLGVDHAAVVQLLEFVVHRRLADDVFLEIFKLKLPSGQLIHQHCRNAGQVAGVIAERGYFSAGEQHFHVHVEGVVGRHVVTFDVFLATAVKKCQREQGEY